MEEVATSDSRVDRLENLGTPQEIRRITQSGFDNKEIDR